MTDRRWKGAGPTAVAALVAAALATGAAGASAKSFERLSKDGAPVQTICNPDDSPDSTDCRVPSLPGAPGYRLLASRTTPLVRNDVVVGMVREKVWRNLVDRDLHIFGVQLQLNDEQSDGSGLALNVNDLFRQMLPKQNVEVAYMMGHATKGLRSAARSVQGLNEYRKAQPARNDAWLDFRIDANAAEPVGASSADSPWLLVRTRAPKGIVVADFGLRLLDSDFADPRADAFDLFTSAYQPAGVPPPDDDDGDD